MLTCDIISNDYPEDLDVSRVALMLCGVHYRYSFTATTRDSSENVSILLIPST